jgi:hypothetical protein
MGKRVGLDAQEKGYNVCSFRELNLGSSDFEPRRLIATRTTQLRVCVFAVLFWAKIGFCPLFSCT